MDDDLLNTNVNEVCKQIRVHKDIPSRCDPFKVCSYVEFAEES